MEKTTNRDYYLGRTLADALAKYDADFAFVDGMFECGSVGTFHDWLDLRWRNPARSYKPDYVRDEFAVTAHEPRLDAPFLQTHHPHHSIEYRGFSYPVYLADGTPVSTEELWEVLHDDDGDLVDNEAEHIDSGIAYYVSRGESTESVLMEIGVGR